MLVHCQTLGRHRWVSNSSVPRRLNSMDWEMAMFCSLKWIFIFVKSFAITIMMVRLVQALNPTHTSVCLCLCLKIGSFSGAIAAAVVVILYNSKRTWQVIDQNNFEHVTTFRRNKLLQSDNRSIHIEDQPPTTTNKKSHKKPVKLYYIHPNTSAGETKNKRLEKLWTQHNVKKPPLNLPH